MTLIWPNGSTSIPRVTSEFNPNRKHPITRKVRPHRGIDLAGWSSIVSPIAGVVQTNAYQAGGAGNYVNIRADDGTVLKFFHLKSRSPLSVGQRVSPGKHIGVMGRTGGVTGVHLHFETWVNGVAIDPRTYYSQRQLHAQAAPSAPHAAARHRNEGDRPMIYRAQNERTKYGVYAHNGGWVELSSANEYNNLKAAGVPEVWVEPKTLAALLEDSRTTKVVK